MELPLIRTVGDERWDCAGCGVCCRGSLVFLSPDETARLASQRWEEDPLYRGRRLVVRDGWFGPLRLAHDDQGACVFLSPENRCRIHERFGAAAKPATCQQFPLQLVPHERTAVLSVRRACPTAAADAGQPVDAHLPLIQARLRAGEQTVALPAPPPGIQAGRLHGATWPQAAVVLAAFARVFGDERYPPVRRVVQALILARQLDAARLSHLAPAQLAELSDLLEQSLPAAGAPYFAVRQPPSGAARLLLRLNVAEFARLHAAYRPPRGWSARGQLLATILRMCWGGGQAPQLSAEFGPTAFAQLERPLAEISPQLLRPEVQRPLERYLRFAAASYEFALANRRGWSITQSVRGLCYSYVAGLWLLRWRALSAQAAGGEIAPRDAALIVSALDRGQGCAGLAGPRHRILLGVLETLGDLERLAVWYAR